MGRRKIEIKAIKDDRNRSVTFLKRKGGLFKKAHELSVLCSVDVAVIIFGSNKKLYEYSSNDMRDLIGRYSYHGGPNEHKGPGDFNGGADDGSDDDGDGTPPPPNEILEAHMIPAHYPGQAPPQFPQFRHHTQSASPPIPNGVSFAQHPGAAQVMQRAHTPQPPQAGSRPGSRNDVRRMPPNVSQPGPPSNGYAFMPHPGIYNPQAQQNMPPMTQGGPQYPYAAPPTTHAPAQAMQHFVDDRPASLPPSFPTHGLPAPPPPPPPLQQRHSVSPPQAHSQQLAHAHPSSRSSTPHAGALLPPPPQQQQQQQQKQQPEQPNPPIPPQSQPQIQEPQPPTPVEPKMEAASDWAVKKLPQRKHQNYSIFTPIDESRSILSQHLEAFRGDSAKTESNGSGAAGAAGHRSLSMDSGNTPSRNSITSSPPTAKSTDSAAQHNMPQPKARASMSSIPETMFTPPSRQNSQNSQNSLRPAGGPLRPRLRVEIPPDGSEDNSATGTGGSASSPRNTADSVPTGIRRNGEPHSIVLPPPSPSASALLSAGASGPPNPFARPHPPQNNNNSNSSNNNSSSSSSNNNSINSNLHIETPGSALPSHFMNGELLPSPSSFYNDWGYGRANNSTTLPSPLNFATPVGGTGPSFLRDDVTVSNKRKSPEASAGAPSSDAVDSNDAKRIKVDN